jgi:hypothetical protein
MTKDNLVTVLEMRNSSREKQLDYLRNVIIMLEYKQLAESIVSVHDRKPIPNKNMLKSQYEAVIEESEKKSKKRKKKVETKEEEEKKYSYLVRYDKSINVEDMWINEEKINKFNQFRQDILSTSLYDATLYKKTQNPATPINKIQYKVFINLQI